VWQFLHAPPGGDNRRVANVADQQIAQLFGEIQIFFGKEIEAFDRFLAKRRCVLNVALIHFEHCAIERCHLPAPVDHLIHVLIDDIDGLFGVGYHIRSFLDHSQDCDMRIDYPGIIFADIRKDCARAYKQ